MKILKNKILNKLPLIETVIDSNKDCPFIPTEPLPKNPSQFFYFVGAPGSGKSSTMVSMLMSKKPRYYRRFFDKLFLISPSHPTLPKKFINALNEERIYDKYNEDLVKDIINDLKEGENENSLLILDDSIRDINKSKSSILNKCILNRRHCTYNPDEEKNASLSVWIMSQKYNLLDLSYRNNASVVFLWKTENNKEKKAIKEELMSDLDDKVAEELLRMVWKKKYNFLMIKVNEPTKDRYYINFDKVVFDDDEDEDDLIENDNINENIIINKSNSKK